MAIEITKLIKGSINKTLVTRAIETTLRFGKIRGDVSIVFVGDARIKTLNHHYRKKNTVTDILSFREAETEMPTKGFVGELVIDYAQIKRQAKKFSHSVHFELAFIVIHGTLHLLGYEDDTEKGRKLMERLGLELIKKVVH